MGVTKGGILVPQPFGYDWELFNTAMNPSPSRPVTFLTCSAGSTIKIVTRIPNNADIDDFDYIYFFQRFQGTPPVNYIISVKNLRTSLVVATAAASETASAWTARRFALTKTNPILPGDLIEITLTATSGVGLNVRTYQKDIYFTSGTQVGQAFPYAQDSVNDRFQTPALFFTWKDADANVITEWMPGLLPMIDRAEATAGKDFYGNLMEMPFTDRRPSGFWLYAMLSGSRTLRIYSEPTSPSDVNELYNFTFALQPGQWKMQYVPLDGSQPRLEQGKKYVVGVDSVAGNSRVFWHQWMRDQSPSPLWTVDPVHLAFENLIEGIWLSSGTWGYTPDGFKHEFGLVFEESET